MRQAVVNRDLERIASFYADDAVLLLTAEPIVAGKEAIHAEWQHVLGIPGMQNFSALKRVDVSNPGDMANSRGTYAARMAGPNGEPVAEPAKSVSIWKKQSDGHGCRPPLASSMISNPTGLRHNLRTQFRLATCCSECPDLPR